MTGTTSVYFVNGATKTAPPPSGQSRLKMRRC